MKCLFQWLVIEERHYIVVWLMWYILRVACPMKVNASYVVLFVNHIRCLITLREILSYYITLLSNHIGSICKYVPTFVLVTRREMREMENGNRFCWPTSLFCFDPPGDRHFFFENFWEIALLLQAQEQRSHTPAIDVSTSFVSWRINP